MFWAQAVTHHCWEATVPSHGCVLGAGEGGVRAQLSQQCRDLWLGPRRAGLGLAALPSFMLGLTRQSRRAVGAGL